MPRKPQVIVEAGVSQEDFDTFVDTIDDRVTNIELEIEDVDITSLDQVVQDHTRAIQELEELVAHLRDVIEAIQSPDAPANGGKKVTLNLSL